MDISKLTQEERAQLAAELANEARIAKQKKRQDREAYKKLTQEFVTETMPDLLKISEDIAKLKKKIFKRAADLIALKEQLYGVKVDQQSHTFSDENNSITLGHRIIDGYDDTMPLGTAMVRDFLKTLAKDEHSSILVNSILKLLRPDKDGNLKPSRTIELQNICESLNNPEKFSEGLRIIRESYKAVKSCDFVEAYKKDDTGKQVSIPLSISTV